MPSTLSVWFFSDHVGTLLYENGNLSFRYDRAWLEDPRGYSSFLFPAS